MRFPRAFRHHHQGEQVNLTARLANSIKTSGASQGDASGAPARSCASPRAKGSGARSAALTRARLAIAITATLAALLLAFSAKALATAGHTFAGSFGGPGGEDGQFNEPFQNGPLGLAVMGSTGDVFTLSDAPGRVQQFSGAGAFESSFGVDPSFNPVGGVAVDPAGGGAVYVLAFGGEAPTGVLKYSASGSFAYQVDVASSGTSLNFFPGPPALAVDPADGTVYVAATNNETGAQVIDSFSQTTGAFIASFNGESGSPDGGFICPSGLAVDLTHHVYVLEPCKGAGRVDKYSAAGAYEATIDDGSRGTPQAVATDPKTGEVYVADAGPSGVEITNFTAGGTSAANTFDASNVAGVRAMAVSGAGAVYVSDATNPVVERFTSFVGPTVTTATASEVETTSATFNGTIDPGGIASEYHYEYGLDTNYGSSTAPSDAGEGSSAIEAPGPVTGLVPNTTYHYRIVGTNASGAIVGADETLSTPAAPPHVDGSPAFVTTITPTGARVHATVNPEHSPTSFRIEYGLTTAYGSSTPEGGAEVGEQSADQAVATNLTGLQPDTLYHYRARVSRRAHGREGDADRDDRPARRSEHLPLQLRPGPLLRREHAGAERGLRQC